MKHVCYVNLMNDAYLDRTLLRSSTKVLSSSSSAIKSLFLYSLSKKSFTFSNWHFFQMQFWNTVVLTPGWLSELNWKVKGPFSDSSAPRVALQSSKSASLSYKQAAPLSRTFSWKRTDAIAAAKSFVVVYLPFFLQPPKATKC